MLESNPKTLLRCLEFYQEDCLARGESSRTVEGKGYSLKRFIKWCAGQDITLIADITLPLVELYRRHLHQHRKQSDKEPLSRNTIRGHLTCIKTFVRRLYYHEVINTNPLERLELPKVEQSLPTGYFTLKELDKIYFQIKISSSYPVRDRAIFETFFASGIRLSELSHLDVTDIDFEHKLLTVHKGKGRKDRRVPIVARTCYWIERYLIEERSNLVHPGSGAALFLPKDGFRFRKNQLGRIVSKYKEKVGINRRGACNLLRHATGTLMHENGAEIRYVQKMLGHSSISTTQVYTHVSPNKLKEVYFKTHPYAGDTLGEQRHE